MRAHKVSYLGDLHCGVPGVGRGGGGLLDARPALSQWAPGAATLRSAAGSVLQPAEMVCVSRA